MASSRSPRLQQPSLCLNPVSDIGPSVLLGAWTAHGKRSDHQEPPSLSEEGLWNPLDSQGLAHAPCAHAGALCILREHPSASCRSLPGSLLITEADPVVSSSRWQDQGLSLDSPRCPDDWADDPAFQVHKELSPTSHSTPGRRQGKDNNASEPAGRSPQVPPLPADHSQARGKGMRWRLREEAAPGLRSLPWACPPSALAPGVCWPCTFVGLTHAHQALMSRSLLCTEHLHSCLKFNIKFTEVNFFEENQP